MDIGGKLSNKNLKILLNYIANANISGSLSVSDGKSEKLLFFLPKKIKLFSIGERKRARIGEILLLMGSITEDQLERAVGLQKNTGMMLGGILIEQGIIDQNTLKRALQNEVFEEVYDLLFWGEAFFNFIEQSDDSVFNTADLRHTEINIDIQVFLNEISKKIDEIDVLQQWVPNTSTVYVLKKNIKKKDCLEKFPGYSGKLLVELLNGENDVEAICGKSKISRYEIYRMLSLFLSSGFIQEATKEDFLLKADEYLSQKNGESALKYYELFIDQGGDREGILKKIAYSKELSGKKQLASIEYGEYGDIQYRDRNFDDAFESFTKAVDLWPDNKDLLYHFGELLKEQEKIAEWTDVFEKTAKLYEETGNTERAIEIYRSVLRVSKDSPQSQMNLARLFKSGLSVDESRDWIQCPVCESKHKRKAVECSECDQRLLHACLSCGRSVPVSDDTCPECGGDPYAKVEVKTSSVAESTAVNGKKEAVASEGDESFWSTKMGVYVERAKESTTNLDFSETVHNLETALLINPKDEKLQKEVELYKSIAAKQQLADFIDNAMAAYYEKSWRRAYKNYKKIMGLIEDTHPRYSDILAFHNEVKAKTRRANVIYFSLLIACIIGSLALSIPQKIKSSREGKCKKTLAAIYKNTLDQSVDTYQKSFAELKELETAYEKYPELSTLVAEYYHELRNSYKEMAEARFKKALAIGNAGQYEDAIENLKNFSEDFSDLSERELPLDEKGIPIKIESEIVKFEIKAAGKVRLDDKKEIARQYLIELKAIVEQGEFNRASAKIKDVNPALLSSENSKELESIVNIVSDRISRMKGYARRISSFIEKGLFVEAQEMLKKGNQEFAQTDLTGPLQALEENLRITKDFVTKEYDEAKALKNKGEFQASLKKMKHLRTAFPDMVLNNDIEILEKEIATYVAEGKKMIRIIKGHIEKDEIQQAYIKTGLALKGFPLLSEVKQLKLPVLIHSKPTDIEVKDNSGELIGVTSVTVMVPLKGKRELVFSKRGFLTNTMKIDSRTWETTISLEKTTIWEPISLNKKIRVEPVIIDNKAVIVTETGVVAFNYETGKIEWEVPLYAPRKVEPLFDGKGGTKFVGRTEFWDLTAKPFLYLGKVVIGGRDGKIYIVNPLNGSVEKVLPDRSKDSGYGSIESGIFIRRVSLLMNEEFVFFGSLDKQLYAVNMSTGVVRWRKKLKDNRMSVPLVKEGEVWVGLSSGDVYITEITRGRRKYKRKVFSTGVLGLYEIGDNVLAVSRSGALSLLKEGARPVWGTVLAGNIVGSPVFVNNTIYCSEQETLCTALEAISGEILWAPPINVSASSSPCVTGGKVFVGSEDNYLFCLDENNGRIIWKYEIDERPKSVLSQGNKLIVFTENGKIYTFYNEE